MKKFLFFLLILLILKCSDEDEKALPEFYSSDFPTPVNKKWVYVLLPFLDTLDISTTGPWEFYYKNKNIKRASWMIVEMDYLKSRAKNVKDTTFPVANFGIMIETSNNPDFIQYYACVKSQERFRIYGEAYSISPPLKYDPYYDWLLFPIKENSTWTSKYSAGKYYGFNDRVSRVLAINSLKIEDKEYEDCFFIKTTVNITTGREGSANFIILTFLHKGSGVVAQFEGMSNITDLSKFFICKVILLESMQ